MKLRISLFIIGLFTTCATSTPLIAQPSNITPLRVAVAGISHGHSGWILGRKNKTDIELVGIFETNKDLAEKSAKQFGFSNSLLYTDLEKMLDAVKPEAVLAFGSIYDHMAVVEACAPKGIHVMVEKPLAANLKHALRMEFLAKKYGIYLLTNYETSWYPTTEKSWQLVNDSNFIGPIRKAVFHHGHQGPKEIGVSKEFLEWLTDPIQNGGGAVIDFGCYGANLMTYLMRGEKPVSVTAVTRQFKPSVYPKVDDEATIIITYPGAQAILQASWNWPFGRKDMEIYGDSGYIIAKNGSDLITRNNTIRSENARQVTEKDISIYTDPFSYLADVIRGKIKMTDFGLYSLQNNIMVVRILEAAKESAEKGKAINIER